MKIYTFYNKILTLNNKWLKEVDTPPVDPYNPLGLPALTIRVKLKSGSSAPSISNTTITAVQGQDDVYDICTANTSRLYDWSNLFTNVKIRENVIEILGANSTDVTNMSNMFNNCYYLVSVPLFNTLNVTNMRYMFNFCFSLTSVQLFDTSKVTDVDYMFYFCESVESGALALYQQMSTQANPPSNHSSTFYNCGSNTVQGAAELAQIPSNWK